MMKIVKSKVALIVDKSDLEECHKDLYLYDTFKTPVDLLYSIGHRYIDVCGSVIIKKSKEVFVTIGKSQLLKESDIKYCVPYDSRFKKRLTIRITSSRYNIDTIYHTLDLIGLDSVTRLKDEEIVDRSIEEPEFVLDMDNELNTAFFSRNLKLFKSRQQDFLTKLLNNSYTDYEDLLGVVPSIKDQIIVTASKDFLRKFVIESDVVPRNIRVLIQELIIKLGTDEIR